jgi:small ligand-binding sensory domain FIST
MHGCMPVSSFMEITRIEDAVLYELDGRPALDVLSEMVGHQAGQPATDNLSLAITIGEKHCDPYVPYDESAYVNRLILSSNPADGSVTLFEADFKVGTRVQIMSRDNQLMLESVQKRTRQLLSSLGQEKPIFALYIDCAGRTSAFSGAELEEASIVQAELGPELPLLGFYSGVEIAPLLGRSRPLDWTGVLTLFTLQEPNG